LRNGGYLFLGYTETLNMINHNFSLTWWQDSFAYYKPENPVKTIETNNQVSMPEIPLDNRFISTSFNEFIFLALQNYKEGNIENVALVVEEIEKNNMSVNTEFYLIKAELLLDRQDFINSAHSCRNAISINPYFLDAHLMLIDIYLQLDMLDRADFEIKTSLYIDNSSILAYYYYSLYCKTIKDLNGYHKAVSKIKRLLSTSGTILSDNLYPINKKRRKHIFKDIMKFQAE
jgi:tetratricopeptide (TPR) repeat protein